MAFGRLHNNQYQITIIDKCSLTSCPVGLCDPNVKLFLQIRCSSLSFCRLYIGTDHRLLVSNFHLYLFEQKEYEFLVKELL